MDFARLYTLQGTTQEEFDRIKKGILAMADGNERDTHFQGFARLLWEELKPDLQLDYLAGSLQDSWALVNEFEPLDLPTLEARAKLLIAQRAYDLAVHVINNLSYHDFEPYTYEVAKEEIAEEDADILSHIPDLTEWPPTETEQ